MYWFFDNVRFFFFVIDVVLQNLFISKFIKNIKYYTVNIYEFKLITKHCLKDFSSRVTKSNPSNIVSLNLTFISSYDNIVNWQMYRRICQNFEFRVILALR